MSRNKASKWSSRASDTVGGRGRLAATRMKPAAASVKPMADNSAAAVRRSMIRTRAWAAPQVAHAGHFVQDSAGPKVSAMLFSAARRLEPGRRGQRWRKVAGASAVGAAGGVAAVARIRRKKDAKD